MTRGDIIGALPGFIAPALIYLGVITANRMQRGTQREMYPSQVIADLTARVKKAEDRQDATEQQNRELADYVHALRDHISKGQPPPPPSWPEGLHT